MELYTTSATWLPSPYLRANRANVIQTLTGNSTKPTFSFTFSSPFTKIPNLGYGIGAYYGIFAYNYRIRLFRALMLRNSKGKPDNIRIWGSNINKLLYKYIFDEYSLYSHRY